MTIAQRLRKLRVGAGLTQRDLAAQAGLSLREVSYIETGRRINPGIMTIAKLSRTLRVSIAWFNPLSEQ